MKYHAHIFVDGSASKGDDIGAWAAIAAATNARRLLYGVEFPSTISRCELRPIIEGLRWAKANWAKSPGYRIRVYSDSEYTVKTLAGLYPRRKNNDLWAALDEAASRMVVEYVWRERNTLPYMTLCDGICGTLRRLQIERMRATVRDPRAPEADMPVYEIQDLEVENDAV